MICEKCGNYRSPFTKDSETLYNLIECRDCTAMVRDNYYRLMRHMTKCAKRHTRATCYCPPDDDAYMCTYSAEAKATENTSWVRPFEDSAECWD